MNQLMTTESKGATTVTMSSLEMVDFINSQRGGGEAALRHDDFMRKVPKVLGEGVSVKFRTPYIHPQNGQAYPCYHFPKREACLMAMSYSYELQAKVFDRMTELEEGKTTTPIAIPQSLPEALRLAADLAEQNGKQALLIEQQKPAVEFVKQYVEAKASKCLSDVAKLIGWKPRAFTKQLASDGIVFKRDTEWVPYQAHIDNKRFTIRAGVNHGFCFQQLRVTPRGIVWLTKRYGGWEN